MQNISENIREKPAKKEAILSPTKLLVVTGLLSAIGLIIPIAVPKIWVLPGVMSITVGSHAAIMLAMFINPWSAAAVTLVTSLGFLISTTPVVALRALSHIVFAIGGSFAARKMLEKVWSAAILNFAVAVVHALMEMLAVYLCTFILKDYLLNVDVNFFYLFVAIGAFTMLHSTIDFTISYIVYRRLKFARLM